MILIIRWLAFGLGLLLLSACTPDAGTTPLPSPTASQQPQDGAWQIHFETSGGLAGVHRTLDLSNDGRLTVLDAKLAKQVAAQVQENQIKTIASQLDKTTSIQAADRLPTCPDCFEYTLDVRFRGQPFSARLNDRTLSGSGLETLIGALMDLQERALAGKLNP